MLQILLAMTTLAYGAVHSHDIQAKEPSRETSSEQAHPDMATYQAGLEARLASGELIEAQIPLKDLPPVQYHLTSEVIKKGSMTAAGFQRILSMQGFDVTPEGTLKKSGRDPIIWNVQYVEKATNKIISTTVSVELLYIDSNSFQVIVNNSDGTTTTNTVNSGLGPVHPVQNSWTE